MSGLHREAAFWVAVFGVVMHSLSSTVWTEFGFIAWLLGVAAIVVLYFMTEKK